MNIIRASELGSCLKAQTAKHLGYDPMETPERMQEVFGRGHEHEDANRAEMERTGWVITNTLDGFETDEGQVFIRLDVLDGWQITGHLDGVINDDAVTKRIWESKSPNTYDKFEQAYKTGDWSDNLAHRYAWQISAYMHATGLEAYVTSWDEERGVRGFGIEVPPYSLDDIRARVEQIADGAAVGILMSACTSDDYPCPFYYLHEKDYAEDLELDGLVVMWQRAKDVEKRGKTDAEGIAAQIKERYPEGIETKQSLVTVYEQAAAKKYDMDAIGLVLAQHGESLEEFTANGKPSQRMKITRRDGE